MQLTDWAAANGLPTFQLPSFQLPSLGSHPLQAALASAAAKAQADAQGFDQFMTSLEVSGPQHGGWPGALLQLGAAWRWGLGAWAVWLPPAGSAWPGWKWLLTADSEQHGSFAAAPVSLRLLWGMRSCCELGMVPVAPGGGEGISGPPGSWS